MFEPLHTVSQYCTSPVITVIGLFCHVVVIDKDCFHWLAVVPILFYYCFFYVGRQAGQGA